METTQLKILSETVYLKQESPLPSYSPDLLEQVRQRWEELLETRWKLTLSMLMSTTPLPQEESTLYVKQLRKQNTAQCSGEKNVSTFLRNVTA